MYTDIFWCIQDYANFGVYMRSLPVICGKRFPGIDGIIKHEKRSKILDFLSQ